MAQDDKKSVCWCWFFRNHISYDCHLWYTGKIMVKWWYLKGYFFIFSKFWFFGLLRGSSVKWVRVSVKWYLQLIFFIFAKIWFFELGGSKGKKWSKMTKKSCLTLYLRNCTTYDCGFWYTCVKWWYIQLFFHFFKILTFLGFQGLSINAKRKFWGVPHLQMCVIFFFYFV